MFERFSDLFSNIFLGSDKAYEVQVLNPLRLGRKNEFKNSNVENVSTVVTCCKVLGDTIGRIPIAVYNESDSGDSLDKRDYRFSLLHYSPDGIISSQNFFTAIEYQRALRGNAYAKIERDPATKRARALRIIPEKNVSGWKMVRGQLYYIVIEETDKGDKKEKVINSSDILHFRLTTKNGIDGITPITALRLNMSISYKGDLTKDSFYENSALSPMAIKSQIPDAQYFTKVDEMRKSMEKTNNGIDNSGKTIWLPYGHEIQQLTIDPIDAKFLESQKYNNSQICGFYGVPPFMAGIYDYSKYNNVETNMLDFKSNTIAALVKMYRSELEMKLLTETERLNGKIIKFNTNTLVELDNRQRMEMYRTMFNMGALNSKQIAQMEGLNSEGLDETYYLMGNYKTIDQIKSGETSPTPEAPTEEDTPDEETNI